MKRKDLFDFTSFFAWTFLNFLARYAIYVEQNQIYIMLHTHKVNVDANTPLRLKLSNSINLQSVITITTLKFSIWDPTSRLHFALSLPLNRKIFNKAGHISLDSLIQQVESCLRMCRETWSKPFIANFWSSREWNARKNWNIIKMRQVMPLQKCQKDSQC